MFQFLPTANTNDFDGVSEIKSAWHTLINYFFEINIQGDPKDRNLSAVEELRLWGRSESDLRFFNPASFPIPEKSKPENVFWSALPTSFDDKFGENTESKFCFLDNPQPDRFPGSSVMSRVQDEYNEWRVVRNREGKIVRVIFTSEPPEFYRFLYEDWFKVGKEKTHPLLLQLYRDRCGTKNIEINDLAQPGEPEVYSPYNKWNNEFCVHMQQKNNTLGAQVNIAAKSAILRLNTSTGAPIEDALGLIRCGKYGDPTRQSDPAIGAAVNTEARSNKMITLENPVGLYMTGLDTSGFEAPNGEDPSKFWQVKKGVVAPDEPDKTMIVRAEYAVPDGHGFTVSDIAIGGAKIRFGAEIAGNIGMRLGAIVSPKLTLPPPRGIGCDGQTPASLGPSPQGLLTRRG